MNVEVVCVSKFQHCTKKAVAGVLPVFLGILEKQFTGCGDKYAFSEDAEWTDVLCASTPTWVEDTIKKYVGRYKQYGQGKDLIKMATYAFILAIKHGAIVGMDSVFDGDPLYCTTVPVKAVHWPQFRGRVELIADCLIGMRDEYNIPFAMSGFDVTRAFDDLSNLTQLIIQVMNFKYANQYRKADLMPIVAFLCFVQWLQDGHNLADVVDDDDPRDTGGVKAEVEDL